MRSMVSGAGGFGDRDTVKGMVPGHNICIVQVCFTQGSQEGS
jgi:hypothetical protein